MSEPLSYVILFTLAGGLAFLATGFLGLPRLFDGPSRRRRFGGLLIVSGGLLLGAIFWGYGLTGQPAGLIWFFTDMP